MRQDQRVGGIYAKRTTRQSNRSLFQHQKVGVDGKKLLRDDEEPGQRRGREAERYGKFLNTFEANGH